MVVLGIWYNKKKSEWIIENSKSIYNGLHNQ